VTRIPQDYHLHTEFSIDSSTPLAALCEQVIELGIPEIAVTDHADFIEADEGYLYYRPDAFFRDLADCRERYGGRLTIRAGVEIGEPHRYPQETDALLDSYPYDFVIGSLHWVGSELVLAHDYFEGKTVEEAHRTYFDELLSMVQTGRFDVVGHLDVVKRSGFDVHGYYDVTPYEEQIREIYRVLIERGKGIEINHGSLRRAIKEPAPNLPALRWYREMGGEVLTLGSDGHRPNGVAFCLADAVEMARAAGFDHVTGYERRRPFPIPLEP
jgi:histidinol-phosphatase (PHP family)